MFINVLIWSIRFFIMAWSSEKSFVGCGIIVWDVEVWFVRGEGRW
jgi:hypothetical protein